MKMIPQESREAWIKLSPNCGFRVEEKDKAVFEQIKALMPFSRTPDALIHCIRVTGDYYGVRESVTPFEVPKSDNLNQRNEEGIKQFIEDHFQLTGQRLNWYEATNLLLAEILRILAMQGNRLPGGSREATTRQAV